MEELRKKIIERISRVRDEAVLREIDLLLDRDKELKELEGFVVGSRIDEVEDDEFMSREEAVKRTANSLKSEKGPEL